MSMNIDEEVVDLVLSTSTPPTSSYSVFVHPLVILGISKHWARTCLQLSFRNRSMGALFGKRRNRVLYIHGSFELVLHDNGGICEDYYETKVSEYKRIYPEMNVIGWYNVGTDETPDDMDEGYYAFMTTRYENPLLLKLNPFVERDDLPFTMWEPVHEVTAANGSMLSFARAKHQMLTNPSEWYSVKATVRGTKDCERMNSIILDHLMLLYKAVSCHLKAIERFCMFEE